MKKEKNKMLSSFYQIYTIIITLMFFVVAFVKITRVYQKFRFNEFAPVFAIVTLGIISLIYFIIKRFSTKLANITATIIYTISSIILYLDCVYFSYMNKFTSVANLKLISLLDSVKESISKVNPLSKWWILIDIPVILVFAIFINKRLYVFLSKKININFNLKKIKCAKIIIALTGIIAITIYSNKIGFKLNYVKSENIIYHIRDFVNVTFDFNKEIEFEEYFAKKEVKKDENYGIAKEKNVVIIQVEALQNFVINKTYNDQEITPFLNSLIKENTFYFNNYYYQVGAGNTSDAEFTVNNSLLSTTTDSAYMKYEQNTYYGLPHILKENGYSKANAYHAYNKDFWNREKAYINQGFDNYYASGDYIADEIIGMGLSDESIYPSP